MALFFASLINPNTLEADLSVSNGVMTIVDHSDYVTNTSIGHSGSNFVSYRKIKIDKPDGTQYVLSSLGDGDSLINPAEYYWADEEYPISDTYTFGSGDGVYGVTLMVVPNWRPSVVYTTGTCVYYGGVLYRYTESPSSPYQLPPSVNGHCVVVDEDDLPVQYRTTEYIAITCCAESCLTDLILAAVCGQGAFTCAEYETICDNPNIQKAIAIDLDLKVIPYLVDNEDWNRVREIINHAKSLCSNCL